MMKRIVIADDTRTARMFIKRCLEIVGLQDAQFVEAVNGKEALELVKETTTDLLLTDLNMPIMDGTALLKWIKADPKLHYLPIIIITSACNQAKNSELTKLGAYKVLNKPIIPATIYSAIKPLLEL